MDLNFFEPEAQLPARFDKHVRYFCGVDLGTQQDYTAIAVIRRVRIDEAFGNPRNPVWKRKSEVFQCGFLERVPLGMSYPWIVSRVGHLLNRPTWAGNIDLTIDQTGVGGPIADLFRQAGIRFTGVTITGGHSENRDGQHYKVPKLILVSRLQALLHSGQLQIHKKLPEAKQLKDELQSFSINYTDSGHMQFNGRSGKHDDCVLALAIAVWRASQVEYKLHVAPFPLV